MPRIVSDIVDVYVYRLVDSGPEFLLLKRSAGGALGGTWQLVHGHIADGETAVRAAVREVREETGLRVEMLHQLERINTFFMAAEDEIHLCPGFAARVAPNDIVVLNDEHSASEWREPDAAVARLMWPGLKQGIREVLATVLSNGPTCEVLQIPIG